MSVKSTRNTKLNYYITDNTILNSIVSISANKKQSNITLLEYNDAIQLTGKAINDDAAKNKTIYDYTKNGKPIDTGITSEQEKDIFYVYGSPHKWVLDNHQQYRSPAGHTGGNSPLPGLSLYRKQRVFPELS